MYAAEGCKRILIADVNIDLLKKTQQAIEDKYSSVEVVATEVDVRDQGSVQAMVDRAVSTFGRVDYCANIAGILRYGDTATSSVEDFETVYQVNLRGVFFCAKAQINAMLKQEPLISKCDHQTTTYCIAILIL